MVVAPDHASSYDDFRLFLGSNGALAEQRVTSVNRTLSIPSTTIVDFTLDSGGASAALTYSETTGTLTLGGAMTPANTPSDPSLPSGAMFQCFD